MRLYSFRIRNFKSIEDTGVIKVSEIDNVTIFAGQNEAGKSAILEALNFLEKGSEVSEFDETHRRVDSYPRVECTYRLNDEELGQLESKSNKAMRSYIEKHGFTFVRGNTTSDDFESLKYLNPNDLDSLEKSVNAQLKEVNPEGEVPKFKIDYLFELRPQFIFYTGFDDYILPNKITKSQLGTNEAVSDFEKVFGVDFDDLLSETSPAKRNRHISIVNKSAGANLNDYWSQKLEDGASSYNFNIDVNIMSPVSESSVTFLTDQGEDRFLYFGQKSKGFRWFSSFNLKLRAHEADSDDLSESILLIDEPGQGLHEEAQKDAKRILNELASKGMQILFTTHQPQLIREDDDVKLSRLKLVVKSKQHGTNVKNPSQQTSQAGFKDALAPVRTAMGLITLDATAIINSKKNIIVEGITDYYYIKSILDSKGINDVMIIPSAGVSQVPNIYSILSGWGLNPIVIVDDDAAGTKAVNSIIKELLSNSDPDEIDKVLFKNSGCKGIEDMFSITDFIAFADPYIPIKPTGKSNADIAKMNSSKEIIARVFSEKIGDKSLKLTTFDDVTKKKIGKLVKFVERAIK